MTSWDTVLIPMIETDLFNTGNHVPVQEVTYLLSTHSEPYWKFSVGSNALPCHSHFLGLNNVLQDTNTQALGARHGLFFAAIKAL